MVQQSPQIGLEGYTVEGTRLYHDGGLLIDTPTDIAEIMMLNERIFLVLDGDPIVNGESYLGENIWCINTEGKLLWKAENLTAHNWGGRLRNNTYRGMRLLGVDEQSIQSGTMEDHQVMYLNPATGRLIPRGNEPWRPEAPENIEIATSRLIRCILSN
jgi:hypothetical protein